VRLIALVTLFLLSALPRAHAADYFLNAPNLVAMEQGLQAVGEYASLLSDFSADFSDDYGSTLGYDFTYYGVAPDGGTFQLIVLGQLSLPQAQVSAEVVEPGNFTSNVGKPVQPEAVTGTNNAVGVESIPDTQSSFWVRLKWNSGSPLPRYAANGITVYAATSGAPPYGGHY